jgi:hypothetical protein
MYFASAFHRDAKLHHLSSPRQIFLLSVFLPPRRLPASSARLPDVRACPPLHLPAGTILHCRGVGELASTAPGASSPPPFASSPGPDLLRARDPPVSPFPSQASPSPDAAPQSRLALRPPLSLGGHRTSRPLPPPDGVGSPVVLSSPAL